MIEVLIVVVLGGVFALVVCYCVLELADKGLEIYLRHLGAWLEIRRNDEEVH